MAACVVCDRPILNPVTLPSGKLCHERCYEEALKKERLEATTKMKGRSAPRPTPPSHPAIRRKPVEDPDDDG